MNQKLLLDKKYLPILYQAQDKSEKPAQKKMSRYGVFSGPYFPIFGLNMEIYEVNLRIQSEHGKIRSEKTSYPGMF